MEKLTALAAVWITWLVTLSSSLLLHETKTVQNALTWRHHQQNVLLLQVILPRPDELACPAIGNAVAFPVKCCVVNRESHAITVVNVADAVTAGPDGQQLIRITPLDTKGTLHPEFATTITTNCLFLPDDATRYQAGLQALAK